MKIAASKFQIFTTPWAWGAVLCFIAFFDCTKTLAQFREHPIIRSAGAKDAAKSSAAARMKSNHTPLELPFWDDFSFTKAFNTAEGSTGYPLDSLWRTSQTVRITEGVGILAPSRNVASFDGLDSLGNV